MAKQRIAIVYEYYGHERTFEVTEYSNCITVSENGTAILPHDLGLLEFSSLDMVEEALDAYAKNAK